MRGHGVLLLVYPESFLRIRVYSKCIARIGKTNTWCYYSLLKCIAIFGGSDIEIWIYFLAINCMTWYEAWQCNCTIYQPRALNPTFGLGRRNITMVIICIPFLLLSILVQTPSVSHLQLHSLFFLDSPPPSLPYLAHLHYSQL